jgi:hypothetical protein
MTISADQADPDIADGDVADGDVEESLPERPLSAPRGSINMDRAARYVEIIERLKVLGGEEGTLKAEKNQIEREILEEFERTGSNNITVTVGDTRRTIFMRRDVVASPTDNDRLVKWFQENGFRSKVRVLSSSLSALVREYDDRGEALPSDLVDLVNVTELYSVRSRKA